MTTVNIDLQPSNWRSKTYWAPSRRLNLPTAVQLPAPFTATANGSIDVIPTAFNWVWQVFEDIDGGVTRYVIVPDSDTPVEYSQLVDVDPDTLKPDAEPEAAWWAAIRAQIASGEVVGDDLILTREDGVRVNAGHVRGPIGGRGPAGPRGVPGVADDETMTQVANDASSSFHASLTSTFATHERLVEVATGQEAALTDSAVTGALTGAGNEAKAIIDAKVGKGELVLNVRDYGAAGDGVTDDTSAIQAALNAGSSLGARVVYLTGDYLTGPLTIPASTTLTGDGHSSLTVRSGAHLRVITLAGDGAAVRDLNIDGNSTAQTAPSQDLIRIEAEGCQASGLHITNASHRIFWVAETSAHTVIRDCVLTANGVLGNCNAFDIRGSHVTISGCHIYDHGNGHVFRVGNTTQAPPEHILITGCLVERSEHNAFTLEIAAGHVTIANCTVHDAPQAVKGDGSAHHITVTGCNFENIHLGTAMNLLAVEDVIITGTRLKDAGGGYLTGRRSIINGCTAENIGLTVESEPTAFYAESGIIANCIATNVTGPAARVGTGGGIIRGGLYTNIGGPGTHYMVAINASESAGGIIADNILRNPTSAHPTATAFALFANRGIAKGNVLDGTLPRGVRVLNGLDHYIVAHNILSSAATPAVEGNGANRLIEGNI